MGQRADRKKQMRKIKAGDIVTWGHGIHSHPVLEVRPEGVIVDAASEGFPRHFVSWEGGALGKGPGIAPIKLVAKA